MFSVTADSSCSSMSFTRKFEQFLYHEAAAFWAGITLALLFVLVAEAGLQRIYCSQKVAALTPREIIQRSPDVFGNVAARIVAANTTPNSFERRVFIFGGSTVMAALVSDSDLHNIASAGRKEWGFFNLALPSFMLEEAVFLSNKLEFKRGDVVILASDLGRFNQSRDELRKKLHSYPNVMFSDPSRYEVLRNTEYKDQSAVVENLSLIHI